MASQNSTSQRGLAMVLALTSSVILSPLYTATKKRNSHYFDYQWNSGYVLPMVLAGLIIAIKTTSKSNSSGTSSSFITSADPSWVLRIGNSSWGLAGVLVLLMFVLSWQGSVQEFLWR